MKKKKHIYVLVLWAIGFCICLTGCGNTEDILKISVRDIAWEREQTQETNQSSQHQQLNESIQPPAESLSQGFHESVAIREEENTDTISFLMEEAGEYAYRCLNDVERLWYRDIEQLLGSFGGSCRLADEGLDAGLTEGNIDKIFQCVLYDHPELFFVEGYSYTKYSMADKLISIEFSGTYNVDRETAIARKGQIEAAADMILAGVSPDASEYEKVKYIYDRIITETEYDLEALDNQNIYSVFIHHLSVCQGYAKATQYLLNRLGIECTLVLGTVETGEGHAWNLAKIDGNYYYLDTTWGDASYRLMDSGENSVDMNMVNYDYLNVTTEELLRTHKITAGIPMPECISTEANYYVREGALFTEYDKQQMEKLFEGIANGSKTAVTIKCATWNCYEEIHAALVEQQEIFHFLDELDRTVTFSQNETQLSMTFWVTNE